MMESLVGTNNDTRITVLCSRKYYVIKLPTASRAFGNNVKLRHFRYEFTSKQ